MSKKEKLHLIKSLRNKSLKYRDLERLARNLDFEYKRSNGDHDIFKHSTCNKSLIIPNHGGKEIASGTKLEILKTIKSCVS